jgi:VanZ family protein
LLSLLPGKTIKLLNLWGLFSFDKLGHGILYAVYTILLIISFQKISEKSYFTEKIIIKSALTSIGLGIILEVLQSFIPDRTFDFWDMIANIVGTIIGISILKIISKIQLIS